jgi:hypothetical protein
MKHENSRHFFMPPEVDDPTRPPVAFSAPLVVTRPLEKREHLLHLATYGLVSLAAAVYILTTLIEAVFGRARPTDDVISPPPAVSAPTAVAPPPPGNAPRIAPGQPNRVEKWLSEPVPPIAPQPAEPVKPPATSKP